MAISRGSPVLASDFNQLAGSQSSTLPFSDQVSATQRLSALFGVGWGNRGYGQSSPLIGAVRRGSAITGQDWTGLRDAVSILSNYLGLSVSGLPDASVFAPNSTITATSFDWASVIAQIDSARFSPSPANLSTAVAISDTRTSSWTDLPGLRVEVDFGTEDAARWFFNSGGEISIQTSFVPAVSNPRNSSWATLIANTGTISFGSQGTRRTGGLGTQGIVYATNSYYSLGASAEELFVIQPPSGTFAATNLTINVERANRVGVNGGNGSRLIFSVFYNDTATDPLDAVSGTLVANLSVTRASNWINIAEPVSRVLRDLNGGTGLVYFEFEDRVTTTVANYDLGARVSSAAASAVPPVDLLTIPVIATVIVSSSGVIGSSNPSQPSFVVPSFLAGSQVRLINSGAVVGGGGQGGQGWSWWVPPRPNGGNGGVAISLSYPTTIINQGTIGGGGGGGGGSSTRRSDQTYDDPGGSGGGGAGSVPGEGGGRGPQISYLGSAGTLTTGGLGGVPSPGGADRFRRSSEWRSGFDGGRGGDLAQFGANGQGDYGFGLGGFPGAAISGGGFVVSGSTLGDVRGAIT
jgi:hypothetical protein